MRLDRDLLGAPRPWLGQRTVLERRRAVHLDEAVDRDLEHLASLTRLLDEIRQVELSVRIPDHSDRRVAEDRLAHPEVAAEERGKPQVEIEPVELGEGFRFPGPVGEPEATQGDSAAQQRDVDAVQADGAAGDRPDARNHGQADQLRQRKSETCGRDQRDHDSQGEPATHFHRWKPSIPTVPRVSSTVSTLKPRPRAAICLRKRSGRRSSRSPRARSEPMSRPRSAGDGIRRRLARGSPCGHSIAVRRSRVGRFRRA